MSFSRISEICLIVGFLLWWGTHAFFNTDAFVLDRYAPDTTAMALYIVSAGFVIALRDPALRLFGALWVIWPVVGSYFTIGQFYSRTLPFQVEFDNGNAVYYISIISMLIGIHVFLFFRPLRNNRDARRQLNLAEAIPLLLFVPLYIFDNLSSGSTLLSGENIVREMYSVDRGIIYSYRTVLILEVTFLFLLLQRSQNTARLLVGVLLVFSILVGVLDGKRVLALLAVLNCIFAAVILAKQDRGGGKAAIAIFVTLLAYGVVANLRADKDTNVAGWTDIATIAGVEYRDFVYSVNQWSPEYMKALGYDYIGSTIATLVNQSALDAIGIDKNALVQSDSARTWQRAFQVQDGIRIGLVGELYFAFPHFFFIVMGIFGMLVATVRSFIAATKTEFGFIVITTQFSLLTLAVFSQSTVTFGTVLTLVYISIAMWLWRQFLIVSTGLIRRESAVSASPSSPAP